MIRADKLKKLLEERGWSCYRLAKEARLSESTVRAAVSGESEPTLRTVEALCGGLGVPPSALLDDGGAADGLTEEERALLFRWNCLREGDRLLVEALIQSLAEKGR